MHSRGRPWARNSLGSVGVSISCITMPIQSGVFVVISSISWASRNKITADSFGCRPGEHKNTNAGKFVLIGRVYLACRDDETTSWQSRLGGHTGAVTFVGLATCEGGMCSLTLDQEQRHEGNEAEELHGLLARVVGRNVNKLRFAGKICMSA